MDRPRQGRQQRFGGRRTALGAAALCVLVAGAWLLRFDTGSPRVDAREIRVGEVERRDLIIEVSGHGVLRPSRMEWVTAQVEGRVVAVHRRAGESIAQGEVLLDLSNPDLVNEREEARSAFEGSKAALASFRVDLDNELLNQKSRVLQTRYAYESALLKLRAETRLRETSDIIADIDFKRTELQVEQLRTTYEIEKERASKSKANVATRLIVRQAEVDQLARAYERARNAVESLHVRGGMSGVVQQIDLDIGQRLVAGSPVAKIARQDQLYAELKVQARQASEVAVGQPVLVDTRNGTVPGRVSRVDPAVHDGTVVVDVDLLGDLPRGARPALAVEGIISTADVKGALVLERPSYGRGGARFAVFRLSPRGDVAERVSVRAGRASVHHIEILDGLESGDRVILSDVADWRDQDRIRID